MFYGDWLYRRAVLSPGKTALIDAIDGDRPITYAQWNKRVNRLATFLYEALGVRKGDGVSIYSTNRLEYLDTLFACNKLGSILHVNNWRLKPLELQPLIEEVAPRVLIYSREFAPQIETLRPNLPSIEHFVALDEPARAEDISWASEREKWSPEQPPPVELEWEDPWIICYTGGTTGLPKGAVLNYRSVTANAVNTIIGWGLRPDDVVPEYMPFFHTGGLNCVTTPLVYLGGTNIVCARFDVEQLFEHIEKHRVTFFFGVPAMLLMIIQHPRWNDLDLSGVRLVMCGGGHCPAVVYEAFRDKGVPFKEGYGLTEAGPNNFWLPAEHTGIKIGSVGRPLFHVDVKLVGEKGNEVGPGEVGHLLIRGPHVFGGYWNRPEATAQTIVDGWLHTGDLAYRDEDGDYYIVGRLKDMIKSGGENIYPAEVESVIHSHPAVAEAALIPVPDPKWGEAGRAVVVLKPGEELSQEELISWLRERMAHYKVPKSVVFVAGLPKTGAGKVDKQRLLALYGETGR